MIKYLYKQKREKKKKKVISKEEVNLILKYTKKKSTIFNFI
jgi:hypothetical protein